MIEPPLFAKASPGQAGSTLHRAGGLAPMMGKETRVAAREVGLALLSNPSAVDGDIVRGGSAVLA